MVERNRRTVLAAGAAALTGGVLASVGTSSADEQCCASPSAESNGWSSYRGTAANTAYVDTDAFPELETVAWEYDETGDVVAVDDWVYMRTDDEIHALDAVDGTRRWKTSVVGAEGTLAVANGAVFVAGDRLTALDGSDGDVLWEAVSGSESMASPTVADGTVYVVADESLYAVDARDGSTAWTHDVIEVTAFVGPARDGEEEDRRFAASPVAVADGVVYALTDPSGFVALDAASGATLWTADLESSGDFVVPAEDGVYVSDFEGGHRAGESHLTDYEGKSEGIGPTVSQERASRFGSSSESFATSGDVRIVVDREGRSLKAWDYERGAVRWEYDDLGEFDLFRAPIIAGDTAVVSYRPAPSLSDDEIAGLEETDAFGTDAAILGIDLESGDERWTIPHADLAGFDHSSDDHPYVVSEDALYINADRLVAVRSSDDGTTEGGDTDDGGDTDGADESRDGETEDESGDDEQDSESDGDTEIDGGLETSESEMEATNETESDGGADEPDGVPGFTGGVGLVGGGLTLEWLRRRAATDERPE